LLLLAEKRETILRQNIQQGIEEKEWEGSVEQQRLGIRRRRFPWLWNKTASTETIANLTARRKPTWERLPLSVMGKVLGFLDDHILWECRGISSVFYNAYFSQDLKHLKKRPFDPYCYRAHFDFPRALALANKGRVFSKLEHFELHNRHAPLDHLSLGYFPRVKSLLIELTEPPVYPPHPGIGSVVLPNAFPQVVSATLLAFNRLRKMQVEFRDVYDQNQLLDLNCFTWHMNLEELELEIWPSPLHRNFHEPFTLERFPHLKLLRLRVNDLESNEMLENELRQIFRDTHFKFELIEI